MEPMIGTVISAIVRLEKVIVFIAFLAMIGALSADVIGREIFGEGVFGSIRFAVYALIYCAMAGFGLATSSGSHLRPKFMDKAVPARFEGLGIRAGQVASGAILMTLAYAGWTFVAFSMELEERDVALDWLIWPIELAIPIGFALSGFRHLAFAVFPALQPIEQGVID